MSLPDLSPGWAWHDLSNDDGFEVASGTGNDRLILGRVMGPVWVPVPVSDAAFDAAFEKEQSIKIDGKTYKKRVAAMIKKYLHGAESIRGAARTKLLKASSQEERTAILQDMVQDFLQYCGPSGNRGGFRKVEVKTESLAEILADETLSETEKQTKLVALLQQAGAKVS